jgi:uncharacterized membrane protein
LFFSVWTDNTVVCSHWEKQTLQGYPILKIVINLAWENVLSVHTEKNKHFKVTLKCLFFSVWTDNTFSHAKFITIFRMGKPWSVCFSQCEQTTHFIMLNLLQFLEWGNKQTLQGYPILKIVINLVWENVCSHWEKQTLQSYPILKIVINLAWENVLSVHTETFSHARFITIFRMG